DKGGAPPSSYIIYIYYILIEGEGTKKATPRREAPSHPPPKPSPASKSCHFGVRGFSGMLRSRAGGRVVKAAGPPRGVAARMAACLSPACTAARLYGSPAEGAAGSPWLQAGPQMLAACSRLHAAELRVELLEVQRQVQRRRGQAARAAGWAGIMPTPSPAAGLSGRVPIHENGVRVMDREPVFLIGGEGGEHPGGDGVLRGDGGGVGGVGSPRRGA